MERIVSGQFTAINSMNHNVIFSIINDSICQNRSFPDIIKSYESYIDFKFTAYRLYYVYFLPFEYLEEFLGDLRLFCRENLSMVTLHGIYVNNTLILFFKDFTFRFPELELFITKRHYRSQTVSLETESILFPSLEELLCVVLEKVRRFGMIYYINDFRLLYTCNYNTHIQEMELLCRSIMERRPGALDSLSELIGNITDITFFKQIVSNLFLKLTLNNPERSSVELTEWLLRIENSQNLVELKNLTVEKAGDFLREPEPEASVSAMTRQIFDYGNENLQDDNLTLKYIAKNFLYMNVDYVSKKFLKETGIKFSTYLADVRIKKAKELLVSKGPDTIQEVAGEVGLGNNPQYFSQLFKKKTGMTPSSYVAQIGGKAGK
jgi:AraC-like DNA-binding protein